MQQQNTFSFGGSGTSGTVSTSPFGSLFTQQSTPAFGSQQSAGFGSGLNLFGNPQQPQPPPPLQQQQQQQSGPFSSGFGSGLPQQQFGTANFKFTNTPVRYSLNHSHSLFMQLHPRLLSQSHSIILRIYCLLQTCTLYFWLTFMGFSGVRAERLYCSIPLYYGFGSFQKQII